MATFMVVGNEILSSDGGVYTLEEAYQMREELKLCISQMETRLTKRAVDLPCCCAEIESAGVVNPDCPRHGLIRANH